METTVFMALLFGGLLSGGANLNNEPHFSFRDGCKMQTVSAGGYNQESYAHCANLPRVYGGKAV